MNPREKMNRKKFKGLPFVVFIEKLGKHCPALAF
jgi:hypothetical protein